MIGLNVHQSSGNTVPVTSYPVVYFPVSDKQRSDGINAFATQNPAYSECIKQTACVAPDWYGFNAMIALQISSDKPNAKALSKKQISEIKEFILKNKDYFGMKEGNELGKVCEKENAPNWYVIPYVTSDFVEYPQNGLGKKLAIEIEVVSDPSVLGSEYYWPKTSLQGTIKVVIHGHFWPRLPSNTQVKPFVKTIRTLKGMKYFEPRFELRGDCSPLEKTVTASDIANLIRCNKNPKLVLIAVISNTQNSSVELRWAYAVTSPKLRVLVDAVDHGFTQLAVKPINKLFK